MPELSKNWAKCPKKSKAYVKHWNIRAVRRLRKHLMRPKRITRLCVDLPPWCCIVRSAVVCQRTSHLPRRYGEGVTHFVAQREPGALQRAGLQGEGSTLGDALFDRIIDSPRGFTFSVDEHEVSWDRARTADGRINASIEELANGPQAITSPEYPFVLSAGERRAYTANKIFRDPA